MTKILNFNKFKLGEIVSVEHEGQTFKGKVLAYLDGDIYKIKVLNGPHKGQIAILKMTRWEKFDE